MPREKTENLVDGLRIPPSYVRKDLQHKIRRIKEGKCVLCENQIYLNGRLCNDHVLKRKKWHKTKKAIESNIKYGLPIQMDGAARISFLKLDEKNPNWAGDRVGICAVHDWVKRRLKRPEFCSSCHINKAHDLANISQKYIRSLADWEWLCRKCHMTKDGRMKNLKQFHKKLFDE